MTIDVHPHPAAGTDYPFPMGEAEPGATIRKTAVSEAEQQALLAGTARAFLRLS